MKGMSLMKSFDSKQSRKNIKRIHKINRKTRDQFIFALLIIGIWQFVAEMRVYPEALFPSAITVLDRLGNMLVNEALLGKIFYSLGTVFMTLILSLTLALIMVGLSKKYEFCRNGISLLNGIASPLPGIAVLPIVILWMGISNSALIVIMIHAMVWPLMTTMMLSVDRISNQYGRMIKVFRIDTKVKIVHIYLRGMIPDLLSGVEIAWSRGWRALISIEMIFGIVGSNSGLGWLIYERRMYMDTAGMIAGLIAIALCGIVFERLIRFAQQHEVGI
ncbi:ABC transporter permease [Fusibacter bizertensis]